MSENKNFINFHVLISHSPSCLNRDDQNMQKRAVFGGVERIRISSQSLKRAMRKPGENAYDYWKQVLGSPSVRTRDPIKAAELFAEELKAEFPKEVVERAAQLFVKKMADEDEGEEGADSDTSGTSESEPKKKIAVAPWVLAEIKEICRVVQSISLTDEEKKKAKEKHAKQKGKNKKSEGYFTEQALINKIKKSLDGQKEGLVKAISSAVDVALWGRMATSGLMTTIDGSLAVAHAITTHAAQADTDWFTAVDDLVQDAGEVGAGHLDTQEFSSGVFYRYASLNVAQLQKNLGGATRERALEIAKHAFHMLCTVVPSAKQQSFAAFNPAEFAIVTFDVQPISLANAFERPVENDKSGGFYRPSVKALAEHFMWMKEVYGLNCLAVAAPEGIDAEIPKDLQFLKSFPAVENWITKDGKVV